MNRLKLAKKSLFGTSVGDSFGQTFFGINIEDQIIENINNKRIRDDNWYFTDDTIMTIAIYKVLEEFGEINQDKLAKVLSQNYIKDFRRGYGGTAHDILRSISEGESWLDVSKRVFDGMGSMGNGAAMRASPIGAYFAEDIEKVIKQSILSAQVTHYNNEGIAGAVAIAVATAMIIQSKDTKIDPNKFISDVAHHVIESDTKYKILKGLQVSKTAKTDFIISVLGNGSCVISQDTVPACIWLIAHFNENFEEAMWKAVSLLGDRDTICAIVAGTIIHKSCEIPMKWLQYLENIEESIFW